MAQVKLRWVAATDADANTEYNIDADKEVSGSFVPVTTTHATNRGDGSYMPYTTTLNGALNSTDTTVVLASATNFSAGDYVVIDKENIKLGTKSTNIFTGSIRGVGDTIPAAHSDGTTVYKAHEMFIDTNVTFGTRKVIRYRVKRAQDGGEAVGVEIVVVNPPAPPYTNICTLWGILEDILGTPQSGVTVQLAIGDSDNCGLDTGESIIKSMAVAMTDEDGFFSFQVRRDVAPLTLSMDGLLWNVQNLPEESSVNFLQT